MLRDTDLQAVTPFITHVQSDGTNIGGIDPKEYGITMIPGKKQAALLRTSGNTDPAGKKYPAWLWSLHGRPMLTTSGRFQMRYKFMLGGDLTGANVFETDTILIAQCADGQVRKFNLSLQRHIASGQVDIGNWTDTGIRMVPLIADEEVDVEIDYAYDLTKNLCSVLRYIDNLSGSHPVTTSLNMPATVSTWSKGAIPQIQLGSLPSAQAWQAKVWDLEYVWQ